MRGPDSLANAVRSVVVAVLVPTVMALASLAAIAMALCGASSRRIHLCYTGFARSGLWIARTRLEVHGAENADPERAYVVVMNHESNWDPLCVVAALPRVLIRFVAKQQIMQIPVLGHALRATGNVTVVRKRDAGDVRRLRQTMDTRDASVSMLFFAEGTRSRDGRYREFKMGAFATAIGAGLPILPVAVAGTYWIWPPETFWFRRGRAVVEVGTPIPTQGLTYQDRAPLRDQTHEAVAKLRSRARERLRARGLEPGGID